MANIAEITQLSPTMTEGILVSWHKKIGDIVAIGDILASVETDKAVMELEAFDEGVLLAFLVEPQSRLKVGSPIAIIGTSGENIDSIKAAALEKLAHLQQPASSVSKPAEAKPVVLAANEKSVPIPEDKIEIHETGARIKISPLAKKIAIDRQIDYRQLRGSGPAGRIIKADIDSFSGSRVSQLSLPSQRLGDRVEKISMMRQTIAKRLYESKAFVPHFYLHREIPIGEAQRLRASLNQDFAELHSRRKTENDSFVKISLNDMIIKANALALREHPQVNAQWNHDSIIIKGNVDVGFAVAIDEGLLTPVIRNADRLRLEEIASLTKSYAEKARNRKLTTEEYTNGSFTISNLGMFGIDWFEAIINAPEAALMAVGRSKIIAEYNEVNGQFLPVEKMTVTLSCDHRVIDGAKGALFLDTFYFFMTHPRLLL